jgi:hypothetical protein
MALVDGGRKLVRDFELQIAPRPLVTSQDVETFGKRAVGGQEVVDAVDLDTEHVLEVCAFGDDAANPVTRLLDCAQFYGREVRKDEDEQLCWKAEERPRTGLERHTVLPMKWATHTADAVVTLHDRRMAVQGWLGCADDHDLTTFPYLHHCTDPLNVNIFTQKTSM